MDGKKLIMPKKNWNGNRYRFFYFNLFFSLSCSKSMWILFIRSMENTVLPEKEIERKKKYAYNWHNDEMRVEIKYSNGETNGEKKMYADSGISDSTNVFERAWYLHATVNSTSPDASSSASPNIHLTLPL